MASCSIFLIYANLSFPLSLPACVIYCLYFYFTFPHFDVCLLSLSTTAYNHPQEGTISIGFQLHNTLSVRGSPNWYNFYAILYILTSYSAEKKYAVGQMEGAGQIFLPAKQLIHKYKQINFYSFLCMAVSRAKHSPTENVCGWRHYLTALFLT